MTDAFDPADHPHRRRNPLTGAWVLVSPHRNQRPWQGQTEPPSLTLGVAYDRHCYLCPGNERMSGACNPQYSSTLAFDNDFPALTDQTPEFSDSDPLLALQAEQGQCRVLAYSPDHSKTLAELPPAAIAGVVDCWIEQCEVLGNRYPWVQVFENKGETMGCSMPHPHGQVWSQAHAPTQHHQEHQAQTQYHANNGTPLLLDYAQRELAEGTRIVVANEDWLVVVPFWAAWPFETLLLPRFGVARLQALHPQQRQSLAQILSELLARYDNLFECAFPYSMGWHGAPGNIEAMPQWQLHAHFLPPLMRSQSVRKFMVGYEMLAEAQRDITPEQAAQILRGLPSTHYKNNVSDNK